MAIKSSKVMWLIGRNIPLGHHGQYTEESMDRNFVYGSGFSAFSTQKEVERMARTIVQGLSQDSVVNLVAAEWDLFAPAIRMAITNFANVHNHSGNVTKGIVRLDKALGGKIRRREVVQTERVLRTGTDGRLYRDEKRVNMAAASASRAFAIVALPSGYENMSPAQKRRAQQELARVRREAKSGR